MNKMKKLGLMAAAIVLVCALSVAGTLAYLQAQTGAVTNTFAVAGLFADQGGITLLEHEAVAGNELGHYTLGTAITQANNYQLIPGVNVPKDPEITVTKLAVKSYLFLEVCETPATGLSWTLETSWTELTGVTGDNGGKIYAYDAAVLPNDAAQTFGILLNDTVTVGNDYAGGGKLEFYAYICQADSFDTAAAAWNAVFATTAP